ncbi:MAG: pitrilysin family protein [Sulfurimicrobium sp.]|nr:pitrilysin family protein [Sulfurimicrobium sp.]MDP1705762.1 pitrilysin family protein [Sulfurimicrobium sp.]MDP2199794.1 pitrilysin family protein [Sulfurimicrobium sp.]MDP3688265.1 pitrilysin family protein [Sulfurimicrobium sp.]
MLTKLTTSLLGGLVYFLASAAHAALPIQHWQTASGAQVYFVESRGLPLLDVSVEFDAGARRDAPAQAGLASLTARTLSLGASGLPEETISRRLADVGAQLAASFEPDRAGMTLRTLSSERERNQSLDLLARVLQQPDFPESAIEREKARTIAGLKEESTQPGPIGEKAFYAALYGAHPYGLPGTGKIETLTTLQRQDVAAFYRRHYVVEAAVISLVGDVSRAQAETIAEQLSAGLPRATAPLPALPVIAPPARGETLRIPHPASQSHILLGTPGMSRNDPDYFALYLGNYILGGGGFASRLTDEVREKRGLAYSVYSYFLPLAQPGPFQIGLQTKQEQSQQALDIVRTTLTRFVTEGPTQDELRRAKQNIGGGFPLRIDSNKKILGYLGLIGFYQLPLNYLDDFANKVDKVTLADVKDAFKRRIDPESMVTVIVGGDGEK